MVSWTGKAATVFSSKPGLPWPKGKYPCSAWEQQQWSPERGWTGGGTKAPPVEKGQGKGVGS